MKELFRPNHSSDETDETDEFLTDLCSIKKTHAMVGKDLHFTEMDPDELAAKVAAVVLKSLEQRFEELEQRIKSQETAQYLTPGDVSRRFNISRDTLKGLVEVGHIERYDVGTHGRYKADELERYLRRYHVKNGRINGK